MDASLHQLVQIIDSIRHAHMEDVKGLVRLRLNDVMLLLQQVTTDVQEYILDLESTGQQPYEIFNFEHMLDIKTCIFDL